VSSDSTSDSALLRSCMSGSLMAFAGGRLSVTTATGASRVRIRFSYAIRRSSVGPYALEEDAGHRLGGVRQTVLTLAEYPGCRELIHRAEEHLRGDLRGEVAPDLPRGDALLEHRLDQVEVGRNLVRRSAAEEFLSLAQLDL